MIKKSAGPQGVADMLGHMPEADQERILAGIEKEDPHMASKIRDLMFQFDDLLTLSNEAFQKLVVEVPIELWVLALRQAPAGLNEKLIGNMSSRQGKFFSEEQAASSPKPLRVVMEAQAKIVKLAKPLRDKK